MLRLEKLLADKEKNFLDKVGGVVGFLAGSAPALLVYGGATVINMINGDNYEEAKTKAEKPMEDVVNATTDIGEAIGKPIAATIAGVVVRREMDKYNKHKRF